MSKPVFEVQGMLLRGLCIGRIWVTWPIQFLGRSLLIAWPIRIAPRLPDFEACAVSRIEAMRRTAQALRRKGA